MKTVISTALYGHEVATTFCNAMLDRVLTFGQWFLDRIGTLYRPNLLTRAVGPDRDAEPGDEKQAWESVTGTLKIFFAEFRKINVKAENAHHLIDKKRCIGLFCHLAVEELRLEEEFKRYEWVRHPLIYPAMLYQIYLNYVPASQIATYCGNTSDLKRTIDKVETAQSSQAASIDKLGSRVRAIENKHNQLKQQVEGGGRGGARGKRKKKKNEEDASAGEGVDSE